MAVRSKLTEIVVAAALAGGAFAPAGLAQDKTAVQPPADKGVTVVDQIEAVSPMVPVPKVGDGAPMFSAEELATLGRQTRRENNFAQEASVLQQCYVEAYGLPPPEARIMGYLEAHQASMQLSAFTQAAQYASQEALEVRRRAAQGKAAQAEVDQSELERQKAVLRVIATQNALNEGKAKALDAQQLSRERIPPGSWRAIIEAKAAERNAEDGEAWNPAPKEYRDLRIENVKVVSREDAKNGAYLHVTGAIRNTRAKRISIPPLSISAIDDIGFALMNETATARGRIEPGQAVPFAYQLKPTPPRAKTVAVTFGDPDRPAWLMPAATDIVCTAPPPELDPNNNGGGRRGVALPTGRAWLSKAGP